MPQQLDPDEFIKRYTVSEGENASLGKLPDPDEFVAKYAMPKNVPTQPAPAATQTPVAGGRDMAAERAALATTAKPIVPPGLQGKSIEQKAGDLGDYGTGARADIQAGYAGLSNPDQDAKAHAIHQMATGGAKLATPAAAFLPGALAAAPVSTIASGLLGYAGQKAGSGLANLADAGPGTQELAGDVGALAGAALPYEVSKAGPIASKVARWGLKAGLNKIYPGLGTGVDLWLSSRGAQSAAAATPKAPTQAELKAQALADQAAAKAAAEAKTLETARQHRAEGGASPEWRRVVTGSGSTPPPKVQPIYPPGQTLPSGQTVGGIHNQTDLPGPLPPQAPAPRVQGAPMPPVPEPSPVGEPIITHDTPRGAVPGGIGNQIPPPPPLAPQAPAPAVQGAAMPPAQAGFTPPAVPPGTRTVYPGPPEPPAVQAAPIQGAAMPPAEPGVVSPGETTATVRKVPSVEERLARAESPVEKAEPASEVEAEKPAQSVPTVEGHPNEQVRRNQAAAKAKPDAQKAAQDLKKAVTGTGGKGVATIKATGDAAAGARANQLAAGHNKYLVKFTGGKITPEQVYDMPAAMQDKLEAQIATAKARGLVGQALGGITIPDPPKMARGGMVVPEEPQDWAKLKFNRIFSADTTADTAKRLAADTGAPIAKRTRQLSADNRTFLNFVRTELDTHDPSEKVAWVLPTANANILAQWVAGGARNNLVLGRAKPHTSAVQRLTKSGGRVTLDSGSGPGIYIIRSQS